MYDQEIMTKFQNCWNLFEMTFHFTMLETLFKSGLCIKKIIISTFTQQMSMKKEYSSVEVKPKAGSAPHSVAQDCCRWTKYQFIWLKKRYYTWDWLHWLGGQRSLSQSMLSEWCVFLSGSLLESQHSWRRRRWGHLKLMWRPSRFTFWLLKC